MDSSDLLSKRAYLTPNRVALVELATGKRYTYAELNTRANKAANLLRAEYGVGKGDRVSILAHNSVIYVDLFYGLAKLGAIFAPFNWRLVARELEYQIPAERKPALAGPIVSLSLLVCVFNISYAHMISRINEKVWFCEPATPTAAIADIYRSFSGATPAWQDFLGNRQICKDSNRPDDS